MVSHFISSGFLHFASDQKFSKSLIEFCVLQSHVRHTNLLERFPVHGFFLSGLTQDIMEKTELLALE